MKQLFFISGALILFGSACTFNKGTQEAVQLGSVEKAAIQTVLDSQLANWNRGNIPGFMEGYWKSDSMYFITSRGFRAGHRATLEAYQRSYPDKVTMGTLQFHIHRMVALDDAAKVVMVHGDWEIGGSQKANKGPFSLIFKHLPEGWRIVADHTW